MKLASSRLELAKPSSSERLHARRVCFFTVSRHQLGVRRPHPSSADGTSSPETILERWQGASIADHLFNQRLFWTALLQPKVCSFSVCVVPRPNPCSPPAAKTEQVTKMWPLLMFLMF